MVETRLNKAEQPRLATPPSPHDVGILMRIVTMIYLSPGDLSFSENLLISLRYP